MTQVANWFERKFEFSFPVEQYATLIVRLRGTPARLEEMLRGLRGAGLFLLEGCGHFPGLTHPEMLAEVVRFFLTPAATSETCGKMHIADCRSV